MIMPSPAKSSSFFLPHSINFVLFAEIILRNEYNSPLLLRYQHHCQCFALLNTLQHGHRVRFTDLVQLQWTSCGQGCSEINMRHNTIC